MPDLLLSYCCKLLCKPFSQKFLMRVVNYRIFLYPSKSLLFTMTSHNNSSSNSATIYTDGACSRNGQEQGASAGIGVYWPGKSENNISESIGGRQTNQRAEIVAARRGIEQAKAQGYDEVTLKTDSAYVKNAAESWIPNWERQGWSKPVVNKEEFQDLRDSMQGIKVNFEKVASKNNAADRLAREGAAKFAYQTARRFK